MDLTQPQPSLRSCSQDKVGSLGTKLVRTGAQTNSRETDPVPPTLAAAAQEQGGLSLEAAWSCSSRGQESCCSCHRGGHQQQLKDSRAVKHNQVLLSVPGDPAAPHGQPHSTPGWQRGQPLAGGLSARDECLEEPCGGVLPEKGSFTATRILFYCIIQECITAPRARQAPMSASKLRHTKNFLISCIC